ncbi:alpha/beta fold hydrolase [Pseudoxanthomonas beigongshangi]
MSRASGLWVIVMLLATAPALAATSPRRAGEIVVTTGTVQAGDGAPVAYEIGTLYVPENRQVSGSRLIGVGFARIRARVASDAPPVFWLPGGPGLAVLDAFDGTSEAARSRLQSWLGYRDTADLVIIEQRGYSGRGEQLTAPAPAWPRDRAFTARDDIDDALRRVDAARAAHPDKDLAGYTIAACADDVDDLRRALGYPRISLFGGSFGSQWSFAVMRAHPGIVARAVLASIEPLDFGYDMPSPLLATMQRIAFEADRDPGLAAYLPRGGLMAAIDRLLERFTRQPITVDLQDGGAPVVIGLPDLQASLLAEAGTPETWPAFVLSLYHGHYTAWARDVAAGRRARPYTLIGPLIDTSLGITPAREFQLRHDPARAYVGEGGFAPYLAAAPRWPTPDLGDDYRQLRPIDVPVLMVHGDWDTSTPIENMQAQLPYLRNGRAIVIHRGGHDGVFYQLRNEPKAKAAVHHFLRTGEFGDLPAEVTLPPPAFARPDFAAPMAQRSE